MASPNLHALPLLLLSLVLLLSYPSLSASAKCHKDDRNALLAVKSFWGTANFLSDWGTRPNCCDWSSVMCDSSTGRVIILNIVGDSSIKGTIPPALADLPFLVNLMLRYLPNLVGPVTPSLTRLTRLNALWLSDNSLSGSIPTFLTTMPNLELLDLSNNKFTGSIPPELSFHTNLKSLGLSNNELTGSIPDSFGKFKAGISFSLADNNLTGVVPKSLGALDFSALDLSRNKLSGDASFLFRSRNASVIFISNNMFEFDLSKVVFPLGLSRIDISNNRIYGRIPQQIAKLPHLDTLNVSYNRLCGKIPTGKNLRHIDQSSYVHNQCLCGTPLPSC